MDLQQLQTFVHIAREGSFSRAAVTLGLAQPTVSHRMRALEEHLGGPLFVRGGRRALLTPRGERLLAYAERALALLDEGYEAARAEAPSGGRASVASTPSLTEGLVAPAIVALSRRFPDAEVFADTVSCEEVMHLLDDGLVKLAVVPFPYAYPPGVEWRELARRREPLVAVVRADHPLADREATWTRALEEARWARVPWASGHTADLARAGVPGGWEVPPAAAKALVNAGTWAAFFPASLAREELGAGRWREVRLTGAPEFHREALLVRHPRGGLFKGAQAALAALLTDAMERAPAP